MSYADLLRVFFSVALDPTEVDRQGPDGGSQYRSVVWTGDAGQAREAQAYIRQLNGAHAFPAPIATKVQPLHGLYMAEAHHQDFLARHPEHPYIQAWDLEKVTALKTIYPAMFALKPSGLQQKCGCSRIRTHDAGPRTQHDLTTRGRAPSGV